MGVKEALVQQCTKEAHVEQVVKEALVQQCTKEAYVKKVVKKPHVQQVVQKISIPLNLVSKVDSVRQVGQIRPTLVKVRSPNTSVSIKYKKKQPVKQIKDNEEWPESSAGNNMLQ